MPRYVKRTKMLRTSVLAERAKRQRVRNASWYDPFPNIHGTLPEKMVYAELSRRGIPFLFLNDLRFQIPEIEFDKSFQADFVIPSMRLIIEVQGSYWHSMEKTIESDSVKFAIYEIGGYRVLPWWDYDIFANLPGLIAAEPQLAAYPPVNDRGSAELPVVARTKVDTSKGIRTLNRIRAQRQAYKKKAVRGRL